MVKVDACFFSFGVGGTGNADGGRGVGDLERSLSLAESVIHQFNNAQKKYTGREKQPYLCRRQQYTLVANVLDGVFWQSLLIWSVVFDETVRAWSVSRELGGVSFSTCTSPRPRSCFLANLCHGPFLRF